MVFQKNSSGKYACMSYAVGILIVLSILLIRSATAEEGQAYIETGMGYITGDFGTEVRSSLLYFDTTAGYVTPSYYVSIGVPYNYISSNDAGNSKARGIGDIVLRGSRVFYRHNNGTYLTGSAIIKLPTADETKQLGSGKMDYGGDLGVIKPIDKYYVSFIGGYRSLGRSPYQKYNQSYLYGVGISRWFSKTQLSASVEGSTSVLSGVQDPLALNVGAYRVINKRYTLKGSTLIGLSTGSPKYGFSIGVVRWF